jgi:hypothetical protein
MTAPRTHITTVRKQVYLFPYHTNGSNQLQSFASMYTDGRTKVASLMHCKRHVDSVSRATCSSRSTHTASPVGGAAERHVPPATTPG